MSTRDDLIVTARASAVAEQPSLLTEVSAEPIADRLTFLWHAMADVALEVGSGAGPWTSSGLTGTPGAVAAFSGAGEPVDLTLAPVAGSGDYDDLTNTPELVATVAGPLSTTSSFSGTLAAAVTVPTAGIYEVRFFGQGSTDDIGVASRFTVTGTASLTWATLGVKHPITSSASRESMAIEGGYTQNTSSRGSVVAPIHIEGMIVVSSAGTVELRFVSSSFGVEVRVDRGTFILRRVG